LAVWFEVLAHEARIMVRVMAVVFMVISPFPTKRSRLQMATGNSSKSERD
jgi:hypothetical protein